MTKTTKLDKSVELRCIFLNIKMYLFKKSLIVKHISKIRENIQFGTILHIHENKLKVCEIQKNNHCVKQISNFFQLLFKTFKLNHKNVRFNRNINSMKSNQLISIFNPKI